MRQKKELTILIKTMKEHCCPSEDLKDVKRAFDFAAASYGGQTRASGKPQIEHALAVASQLAEWKLTPEIVIAGLLHDIFEYTKVTEDDIRKKFGFKVARLITGENRLDSLKYWGKEQYAENLRRMFLAMAEDVQIVFIKFADRIDNLKTLEFLPEEKRRRLADESIEIYGPIAGRLGMGKIRQRLEDLAFRQLYPKEYAWAEGIVAEYLKDNEQLIKKIKKTVAEDAKNSGIKIVEIRSRTKSLYSLYNKLSIHERNVDKIYDIMAIRIIVEDIPKCYALLGIIHHRWKPLPRRIKDYIAQPKPNGYRSLHTNVFTGKRVMEFQIRTPEMQDEAKYGIAAHWIYKEKQINISNNIKKHTEWLKELSVIQKDLEKHAIASQAMRSVKIDLFKNRIFVFTPKGDVIELPEDATPLDFAYAVHADLGNHCKKAFVNEMPAALDKKLRSNDVIKIQKSDRPCVDKHWLKIVCTRRARKKIREALNKK